MRNRACAILAVLLAACWGYASAFGPAIIPRNAALCTCRPSLVPKRLPARMQCDAPHFKVRPSSLSSAALCCCLKSVLCRGGMLYIEHWRYHFWRRLASTCCHVPARRPAMCMRMTCLGKQRCVALSCGRVCASECAQHCTSRRIGPLAEGSAQIHLSR